MTLDPVMNYERTCNLIDDMCARPAETAWIEFKQNKADGKLIGKLISALSNAARLADQSFAYVVWGVRDHDHAIVGTNFQPTDKKEKGQSLEIWLARNLRPAVDFRFEEIAHQGQRLIIMTIAAASSVPVEFDRTAYIRIGSATPRLSDYPERERALWARLQSYAWEAGIAAHFLTGDEVLKRLDYVNYFNLTGQPLPDNHRGIFEKLESDRLISLDVGEHWNISNLGAILFAKKLSDFGPSMERKAVRFVAHGGTARTDITTHRQEGVRGYASGFQGLVDFINALLPRNEYIGSVFREEERPLYPAIAIRELIANALIHQDMSITGAGPLIEMFTDRMEITNPGIPLISPERFLDFPPRSRNEALASLMRRMRFCEEQGTGIDKVISAVERHQLPPPDFRTEGEAVRVVFFAPRAFAQMSPDERLRACLQHAALKHESGKWMTNTSLRERLGIDHPSQASVIIRQAQDADMIRPADPEHPRAGYVPAWL